MDNVKIESLDHFGRGIAHIYGKVIFIKNALPHETVNIKIIKSKKNYSEAVVTKYITCSKDREKILCPYFNTCGGCNLLFLNYENTLDFKEKKVEELFNKNNIKYDKVEVIKNPYPYNYRNKISLKIKDGNIGFYEEKSHNL
ncbi:MAG: TRAM domain-containing protein, partial [Ruminococcus sp.]|nr:TRAM domain-containing protein [Ruminococcus sp.]